jgi:YesN/AraC family two-component response regulator
MQKMILESKQIKDIELAQNGFEGYNKVLEKNYDLVICDLNMPVMDGFRFC